ncbi:hypothetical protein ACCUM_2552 [Candidatus Accumulibacter phosphatis]|uniref:Uncharacterized protein n=1 Tax=Candidatus Accumulibacter phosphatis TaxID=327160 RepID=A0A5S4EHX3_9PROT|nr:hypothetical protein ACCUM_2552 [Candidatus Accumulibacter phosphatis]
MHHVAVPDLAGASSDKTAPFLGQARRAGDLRQALLLEQAVDARTRQGPPRDGAGDFEQALDLADRAAGVLALGGENCRLDGGGEFRLAAIGPHLGDQSVEAAGPVAVIPPSIVFSPRERRSVPGITYSRAASSRRIFCNSPCGSCRWLISGPWIEKRNSACGSIWFMGTPRVTAFGRSGAHSRRQGLLLHRPSVNGA